MIDYTKAAKERKISAITIGVFRNINFLSLVSCGKYKKQIVLWRVSCFLENALIVILFWS